MLPIAKIAWRYGACTQNGLHKMSCLKVLFKALLSIFWKVMNMNFGYVQWIVVPFIASPFESQLVLVSSSSPFFFVCPFSFIPKGARSLWIYFSCHIHLVIKYQSRFWKLFRLCLLSICLFKQIEVAQVTNFPKTLSLYQSLMHNKSWVDFEIREG